VIIADSTLESKRLTPQPAPRRCLSAILSPSPVILSEAKDHGS